MVNTDLQLLTEANVIKNETATGANTATRVGTMLDNLIYSKINSGSISANAALGTSNVLVPSQYAVKQYVDTKATTLTTTSSFNSYTASVANTYISTGSISIVQAITGSLRITGSLTATGSVNITGSLRVTGSIRATQLQGETTNTSFLYPTPYYAPLNVTYNTLIPSASGYEYYQSQFPSMTPYSNGGGSSGGGGNAFYYYIGDLGIGNNGYTTTGYPMLEAIYLKTYQTAGPQAATLTPAKSIVRTIISDNSALDIFTDIDSLITANNRTHILTVTGSMLAIDGVSLGTNIANKHYITGSVKMSGSFQMNSTGSFILPTTASASPIVGQVYFNFKTNKLYAYNGTAWVTASLGS